MDTLESPEISPADDAFADALARARSRLRAPETREKLWPAVVAALMFAICALSFATAAILAPPVQLDPITAHRAPPL
jgi:hypothetical protein